MSEDTPRPGWFIDEWILASQEMTATEKLVMAVICNLDRLPKKNIASNRYIGSKVGLSVQAVKNALVHLRKKGLLAPNTTPFPQEHKGPRLVPIVPKSTPPYQFGTTPVPKTISDSSIIVTRREREVASLPPFFLQNKSSILQAAIAGSPITEDQASQAFDQIYRDREASGTLADIGNFPALIRATIAAGNRPAPIRRAPPPPAVPVSQFSRCH